MKRQFTIIHDNHIYEVKVDRKRWFHFAEPLSREETLEIMEELLAWLQMDHELTIYLATKE